MLYTMAIPSTHSQQGWGDVMVDWVNLLKGGTTVDKENMFEEKLMWSWGQSRSCWWKG